MPHDLGLTERILEGDVEAIIIVLIPLVLAVWWFMHVYILPARRWKPPSGPKERTHFYRRKKVTEGEGRPRRSSRRERGDEAGAGGPPDALP